MNNWHLMFVSLVIVGVWFPLSLETLFLPFGGKGTIGFLGLCSFNIISVIN